MKWKLERVIVFALRSRASGKPEAGPPDKTKLEPADKRGSASIVDVAVPLALRVAAPRAYYYLLCYARPLHGLRHSCIARTGAFYARVSSEKRMMETLLM